jgi:hypothetical protein
MIVFLLVCVLTAQAALAGVVYLVICEQRRSNESMTRIHSAMASFEQRRAVSMMQHELELYFQQPIEQFQTPVDILPDILEGAWNNYAHQRKAA